MLKGIGMEIKEFKVTDLKEYERNPRHNDDAVEYVAESIKEFGFKVPIVVDKDNVIIAGHTRLKAAKELGLETVPCIVADDLTEEQVQAFRLADNKVAELAEWDTFMLAEELDDIINIDMELFGFVDDILPEEASDEEYGDGELGSLERDYIVPPFSVLDTRQGRWQKRKKHWLEVTGDLSETRDGEFGKLGGGASLLDGINGGTSNFDPVLAEIMYKWFCVEGGKILDPFGGEQTKGVVAGYLGYKYQAVEFRQEQVDLNNSKTEEYDGVDYYCGDSNNIKDIIKERDFDLCFTSPPYYDLEVYSEEDMSALGTYEDFMEQYKNIFEQCYEMLADNSFLVIKIGEIRDKKGGQYRGFVADNIKMFQEIGFEYYNEITLVNAIGTAAIRSRKMMGTRKVVKVHQNVLVFHKGGNKKIKDKFKPLDFPDEVFEGVEDETA